MCCPRQPQGDKNRAMNLRILLCLCLGEKDRQVVVGKQTLWCYTSKFLLANQVSYTFLWKVMVTNGSSQLSSLPHLPVGYCLLINFQCFIQLSHFLAGEPLASFSLPMPAFLTGTQPAGWLGGSKGPFHLVWVLTECKLLPRAAEWVMQMKKGNQAVLSATYWAVFQSWGHLIH